ncbi:hypothetical protein GWA97_10785 [Flavobacterium sp. LaA7.5]|nr:hypothetical protein [Flavobacterium salilacus subsp. altitudinum]
MANEKVTLASLDLDINGLIKAAEQSKTAIETLKKELEKLKEAGKEASKEFKKLEDQINTLTAVYTLQQDAIKKVKKESTELKQAHEDLTKETQKTIKAQEDLSESIEDIADSAKDASKEIKNLGNSAKDATDDIDELFDSLENTSDNLKDIEDAAEDAGDGINELNDALQTNESLMNKGGDSTSKSSKLFSDYKKQVKDSFAQINIFNGGLGGFISRAQEAGGVGPLLKNSFSGITTGISGMTKAGRAFIATPIGAAITALVVAFEGAKAIFEFNKGLQENNKELKSLGVNANEISKVRSEISATAETFNKDFKDVASSVKKLAEQYKISMSDANDIVAQGLAGGGALNNSFLGNIEELSGYFEQAGYSAQEFINIMNNNLPEELIGKIPAATQEAYTAIQEQSKTTRDALTDAFGSSFTDEILQKVKTGEITTKKALSAIALKSNEVQLTQQQQANLTSSIFNDIGKNSAESFKIFETIVKSSNTELSNTAKKQLELQEATERLNKAQSELFEVKNFGDIWTNIKTVATEALAATIEYLADLKKDLQPVIDFVGIILVNAWNNLKTTVSTVFNLIAANFKIIGNTISTFINFFKKIVEGDFKGAIQVLKDGFTNFSAIVQNTFAKVKNTIIQGIQDILDNIKPILKFLGIDIENLNKSLEGMKNKTIEVKSKTTTTEETTTKQNEEREEIVTDFDPDAEAKKQKAIDKRIAKQKEEIDSFIAQQGYKRKSLQDELKYEEQIMQKRLALLKIERDSGRISKEQYENEKLNISQDSLIKQNQLIIGYNKAEFDLWIKQNQSKLDGAKKLTEDLYNEEAKRLENVKERQLKQLELEKGLNDSVVTQKQLNNEDLTITEIEYLTQKENINNEYNDKIEANNTAKEQLIKQRNAEELAADREVKLAEAQTEYEEGIIQEQIRHEDAIARLKQMLLDEKITKDQFIALEREETEKTAALKTQLKLQEQQQQLQTLSTVAGAIGEAFGQSKALASVQAGINGALAITSILAQYPKFDGGFAMAAAIGAATASTLIQLKKINSAKAPKKPKFEKGGLFNVGGNRHSAGGTLFTGADGTQFEAEQGELIGVMNRNAARHFMAFNNAFPAGGASAPNYFANGGIVSRDIATPGINTDELAAKIAEANRNIPAPVVSVQDIVTEGNSYVQVRQGADF